MNPNSLIGKDLKHLLLENQPKRKPNKAARLTMIGGSAIIAAILITYSCGAKGEKSRAIGCTPAHAGQIDLYEARLTSYFRKNGSPQPEKMAAAVMATSQPKLLAAIAKRETRANPKIRRAGYKNRHDGAFQVNPTHWGKVPNDAKGQALQADAILQELIMEHGTIKGLSIYAGDTSDRSARMILAELESIP